MTDRKPGTPGFPFRPWGLLTAAGTVASISTVLALLGRFSWFLDLFSHFRVQYLLGLLVVAILLLFGRHYKVASVFLFFACVNAGFVLPLYFGKQPLPAEATPIVRVMLLNVNNRGGDPERVGDMVVAVDPDILVLQEISARWLSALEGLKHTYPYTLTRPREDNFGIGLFSKLPIAEGEIVYIGSIEVPSILATLRAEDTDLRIIATHPMPPIGGKLSRSRNEQLDLLPAYTQSNLPILLLGDLNVTPWNYHFRRLLARSGLRDSVQGYGVQPTWPNFSSFLRIPLDHCLHSEDIVIVDRKIGEDVASDHFPLIVDFVITTEQAMQGWP